MLLVMAEHLDNTDAAGTPGIIWLASVCGGRIVRCAPHVLDDVVRLGLGLHVHRRPVRDHCTLSNIFKRFQVQIFHKSTHSLLGMFLSLVIFLGGNANLIARAFARYCVVVSASGLRMGCLMDD